LAIEKGRLVEGEVLATGKAIIRIAKGRFGNAERNIVSRERDLD